MKILKFTFFAALVFLIGCQQVDVNQAPIQKDAEISLLKLNTNSKSLSAETIISANKVINGEVGGTLEFNFPIQDQEGNEVIVYGNLTVPAGAYNGNENITVVVNSDYAVVDFYPSPKNYNLPLLLNLSHVGVDVSQSNLEELDFYFIEDTNFELIENSGKSLNQSNSQISVSGAKLHHFSRFGWGK